MTFRKINDDYCNLVVHDSYKDVLFVRHDFWSKENEDFYNNIKSEYKYIIGLCSYQNFPQLINCPHENRPPYVNEDRYIVQYNKDITAFFHCFREPEKFIPNDIPLVLMSESDYITSDTPADDIEKKYDILCYISESDWSHYIRKIDIARKFLNSVSHKYKICVSGSLNDRGFNKNIHLEPFMDQNKFIELLLSAKSLFVSNEIDASPRIITQAITRKIPVMLNKNIYGGWKYITPDNGLLFDPNKNTEQQMDAFMTNISNFQPSINPNNHLEIEKSFMNIIENEWELDAIFYINLDESTDRKKMIDEQLEKYNFPKNKITRVPAVENKICGHYGCCLSHIKTLELAKKMKCKKFMILEDDFMFELPEHRVKDIIKREYDVLLLAEGWTRDKPKDGFGRVNYSTTTPGYVTTNKYLDTLLDCFKFSERKLRKEIANSKERIYTTSNAIDQDWIKLQEKDMFMITNPPIGKQNPYIPSVIMKGWKGY